MAGIDYRALRSAISLEQILRRLDYRPSSRRGQQLRGTCPIHDPSGLGDRRCFSVHLGRHVFRCFACGARGNQLDLWRLVHRLPLYESALLLCQAADLTPSSFTPSPTSTGKIGNSPPPSSRPATG
jgi:DNA primase